MKNLFSPHFGLQAAVTCIGMALLLGGCAADRAPRASDVSAAIRAELPVPKPTATASPPAAASSAPAQAASAPRKPVPEKRLDLLVNNAQARDVFLAIVADTLYSMKINAEVKGTVSMTLRGVTVSEALEALREVYGYDYKIVGRDITIYGASLQTRIFNVNYPNSQRVGSSEMRVSSGASQSSSGSTSSSGSNSNSSSGKQSESSSVATSSKTDFWSELAAGIKVIVGTGEGRSIVTSPQAGIMVVRAMPDELRQVEKFLTAAQVSVHRQVMLEAKIVEVELREAFQSGVNWSALNLGGGLSANVLGRGLTATSSTLQAGSTTISGLVSSPSTAIGAGLFGLALETTDFSAVMGFLETQGDVQTLSSPRVATLNNQKAVLKVGTDSFFVTGVTVTAGASSSTGTGSTSTTATPTISLSSFFSGISLDVTPQIDDGANVTLHIHPAVSNVTEVTKVVNLGDFGSYQLPLASSAVNETDTLVRIQDGRIVAIGGLMQLESSRNASGLPGTTGSVFASLFGNKTSGSRNREVIVLIKPTIIRDASDWDALNQRSRTAIDDMDARRARSIELNGSLSK